MRGRSIILIFLFGIIFQIKSIAQEISYHSEFEEITFNKLITDNEDVLDYYLATDAIASYDNTKEVKEDLLQFVEKLHTKKGKFKDDERLIEYLFYKTHRKFLKDYQQYSTFFSLLDNGAYDCLSGTTLYSYLLSSLGYDFKVIETNYHIFLLVNLEDRKILLESTDPLEGYIDDQNIVSQLVDTYRTASASSNTYYKFSFNLENTVNPTGLIGLLYYNQAVKAINSYDIDKASQFFEKAKIFYTSRRMKALEELLENQKVLAQHSSNGKDLVKYTGILKK